MPINKNALLRYQILDRCFSDRHRRYEIEDLVDKVNDALLDMYGKTVSLRQIRADITYMRDRVSYMLQSWRVLLRVEDATTLMRIPISLSSAVNFLSRK